MSERRLLKFKYGSSSEDEFKKCLVKYEFKRDDGYSDVFTFECDDEPHPDLKEALEGMVEHLLENCEIASEEGHKITVKSVTCTYKDMDDVGLVRGLVISGVRELRRSNSPMVLNSPHKTDQPYTEDGDDDICLSSRCIDALYGLEREVFAYLDGKRAQGELDFGDQESDTKPAA